MVKQIGLQIWIKQSIVDGEKYLQYKYTTKDGKQVGTMQDISFKQTRILNSLCDSLEMELGI